MEALVKSLHERIIALEEHSNSVDKELEKVKTELDQTTAALISIVRSLDK